jgi:hypothetical protein
VDVLVHGGIIAEVRYQFRLNGVAKLYHGAGNCLGWELVVTPSWLMDGATMYRILALVAVALISFPVAAQRPAQGPMSETQYTPEALGYELHWEDVFEGDALNPEKWAIRGEGKRGLGRVAREAIEVSGGFLKLKAFEKDGEILVGAVGTQD